MAKTEVDYASLAPQLEAAVFKSLDSVNADVALKVQALELAFKIAAPLAQAQASTAAGGSFLEILAKLIELLLPILLKLLGGAKAPA